uniref:exonuclease mut-7 homolog isoform X2 n=1 Tax=Jaculus jaculus TaxID=51337 RepID=UPI001E1AF578|nr:exonuclease mut-7 homolog isoform X2 [Jaculus jaculus]
MDPEDPPVRDLAAGDTTAGGSAVGDPTAGVCCSMDQDPLPFLQALKVSWSTRDPQQLREEAWRGFAALDDPLARLLDMLEGSQGWKKKGSSLQAWVVCELRCWLQTQPCPGPAQSSRLKQLQARAIEVLVESPSRLVEPLVSIFQLQDTDKSPLLAHVHHLHHEGKFKEAIVLGTRLKLQPELEFEKMSTPLLLQAKMNLVENYVVGFPDLQRRLLALMDSWCQPGFDIRNVVRQYPKVTSVRLEMLRPKVLRRHVLRLRKQYHVDLTLCPNAITMQRLGALQYLCYKRFVEKSLSQEIWADHVQDLVMQSSYLQKQLLKMVSSRSNLATTAQCALDLSLPEEQLPDAVAAELRRLRLQGRTSKADSRLEEPQKNVQEDYYQMPIARENIHLLASWEDLTRHEATLLQPGQVVGIDVEWRPSFIAGDRCKASLLQVAKEGCVFLLDVSALLQPPEGQGAQAFSRLVAQLFSDPTITKLGYGTVGDLQSLITACPALASLEEQTQGSVDLLPVHKQIQVADMPAPSVHGARGPQGLSLLVQQVLGKPLDKTQTFSNWDRRPLCEGQLVYAATDAYCLLEVHRALCGEPARFPQLGNLGRSWRPRHSARPEPWEPTLQEASVQARQVLTATKEGTAPGVPARAFRVVCDSMLQELARSLRCLGVDAVVLGKSEDHHRATEMARQEGRIILTSGMPNHKLQAQVGAGRCLSVNCALRAQQQAKDVLRHFNVRVTHADIFSRCQACNGDQCLKVSKDLMEQLVQLNSRREGPGSTGDEATQSKDERESGPAPETEPGRYTCDSPCQWLQAKDLQASTPPTLGNGTRLQLEGVTASVLRRPRLQHFYCCTRCGKVFWEGSHGDRITMHFHEGLEGVPQPFRVKQSQRPF